jgi:hypothetical protein
VSALRSVLRLLTVLWAGSLWSLAAWVAPTLFTMQSDRHVAGQMAARLFGIESYVGLGVALLAVLLPQRRHFSWGYVAAALLALDQWLLKPIMAAAQAHGTAAGLTFGAWHGVSAALYLLACAAVIVLVWKGPAPPNQRDQSGSRIFASESPRR